MATFAPSPAAAPASSTQHLPVLAREAVEALAIEATAHSAANLSSDSPARRSGVYLDATFGRGGHTRLILMRLSATGRLIAMDRDQSAIDAGTAAADLRDARLTLLHARFGALAEALAAAGLAHESSLDGVLMDLGVSSPQLDRAERGFSFRHDGPLDMRMDQSGGMTAAEWLATAQEDEIREVLQSYGQERFAKQVAKAIVAARAGRPLLTTRQLAAVVGEAVRTREPGKDPATRTFQALRIHVNKELEELSLALPQALAALRPGGRLAVISFHSLEDRMVKNFMRDEARPANLPERLPVRAADLPAPRLRIVGKPVRASDEEVAANPRARSAILRVAEKTAEAAPGKSQAGAARNAARTRKSGGRL